MNLKKTAIAVAITAGMLSSGAQAAIIDTLFVGGGTFSMGVFTPTPNPITGSSIDIVGAYNAPGWDTNTAQSSAAANSIASFDFNNGGTWVNTYTASTATQPGVAGGGPAPSGTVGTGDTIANGDAINVDLSSFFANWNGTDFSQGSASATGTVSNVAGNNFDYSLNWTSKISGGSFTGQTGTWNITGTGSVIEVAAPIPEPETYLMMLSGLGLLGVIARRRLSQSQQ